MDIQADCALIYSGHNIYLPTAFCQSLLYGHILITPDPDTPTGLYPLLIRPSSTGLENTQQRAVIFQVLIDMVQYQLSKEEADELLEQRVHVVATTQ